MRSKLDKTPLGGGKVLLSQFEGFNSFSEPSVFNKDPVSSFELIVLLESFLSLVSIISCLISN